MLKQINIDSILEWSKTYLNSRSVVINNLVIEPINRKSASTRSYYKLTNNNKSWLVMQLRDHEGDYLYSGEPETSELTFISLSYFYTKNKIKVPAVYYYDKKLDLLLIEYLGSLQLYDVLQVSSNSQQYQLYDKAMKEILKLQKATLNATLQDSVAIQRKLCFRTLLWEFYHFMEWGIEKRLDLKIPTKKKKQLINRFTKLSSEISSSQYSLTHRDFHSKNLMVLPAGEIGVIDFQDTLLGPQTYDLASLLLDIYVDTNWELVDHCVSEFYSMLVDSNIDTCSHDEYRRLFDMQGIQRSLKVVGRFNYLAKECNQQWMLNYVDRALNIAYVLMSKYSDLRELQLILKSFSNKHL